MVLPDLRSSRSIQRHFVPYYFDLHNILCYFKSKTLQDNCITLECFNKPRRVPQLHNTRCKLLLEGRIAFDSFVGRFLLNCLVPQGQVGFNLKLDSPEVFDKFQAHSYLIFKRNSFCLSSLCNLPPLFSRNALPFAR